MQLKQLSVYNASSRHNNSKRAKWVDQKGRAGPATHGQPHLTMIITEASRVTFPNYSLAMKKPRQDNIA